MGDIAYQNKDITSKVFADNFKGKQLRVYGLDIPKVVEVLPTNLPDIEANELRIDNLFLLEDGTIAIIDYESAYSEESKGKYLSYITRVLKRYYDKKRFDIHIHMIVIYTADVDPLDTNNVLDIGCLRLEIDTAFLSKLNSEEIKERLSEKVANHEKLTDEELMEFIILPLTYHTKETKMSVLKEAINMAKNIADESQMVFILSGIVVFSDKIIDEATRQQVKEWISMTQIGRMYAEEKRQAVKAESIEIATRMIKRGFSIDLIQSLVPALSENELKDLQESLQKEMTACV